MPASAVFTSWPLAADLVISAIGFILFQFFPRQIIGLFGNGDELYFDFAEKLCVFS